MRPVAIIDGGFGSVGSAAARALAEAGYRLALTYRQASPEQVNDVLNTLAGDGHYAAACDIADAKATEAFVRKAAELGTVTVCIHTASDPIMRKTLETMSDQEFRGQFEATVFGAHNLFTNAIPHMKSNGGLIVGITTTFIEPDLGAPRMGGYISAKNALRGLLRELSKELKSINIRVNAIAPDLMRTKLSSDLPARFFEWAAERDPRGRITTPEDVAERILSLVNDTAITGMSMGIDGVVAKL